jgi:lipoprotein-anchoring transpeptidase ErfK/SrfK
MRHARAAVIACLAAAALPAAAAAAPRALEAPTPSHAWTARVLTSVSARAEPRPGARSVVVLHPVAPLQGGPTVLLVTGARRAAGREWVRLRLPVRPNGTQGWVPADAVRFNETRLRIVIAQGDRRLTLYRAGRPILNVPVAVGTPQTPTPDGRFAVAEMIRTRAPGAFLGPIVFPLTGYSDTLNEYAGGDGRVAIHGTSLPALIGTRASHGCIRVENRWIVRLSRLVRPGTPVQIRE